MFFIKKTSAKSDRLYKIHMLKTFVKDFVKNIFPLSLIHLLIKKISSTYQHEI